MKKKRFLCIFLILCFIFSGCKEKTPPLSSASEVSEEVSPVSESDDEPVAVKITVSVEDALKAYTAYLKKIFEDDEEKAKKVRYTIAYINSDDVPELIYMDEDNRSAGAHVLICDNDLNVSDIGEFGEYGSLAYREKTGMILSYYTSQSITFADFYMLRELSLIDDTYFEMDQPVLEGDKARFYVDGDETDEVTYYEKYSQKETPKYTYVYYEDALSYYDTDDVLRVLSEYAATGKKPSIINLESQYPMLVGEWVLSMASIGSNNETLDAASMGVSSYLKISAGGNIRFKMTYEDKTVEDEEMTVNYIQRDEIDKRYACIGFKNEEGTREFLVFTSENNTVTAVITDLSGEFTQYSFVFLYIKAEEAV